METNPLDGTGTYCAKPTEYHKWLKDDEIKVKLMKMSKGYQWEITYEGKDTKQVIARIEEADNELKTKYNKEEE